MEQHEDSRGIAESTDAPSPESTDAHRTSGSRGKVTTRPSRESILQSYASQDEMRARDARLRSQQTTRAVAASAAQRASDRAARQQALEAQQREQAARASAAATPRPATRRGRVVPPLSSQESYDMTRSSRESYERARASRDALSESRRGRALNREVIDGRGSIDSRTFNESHRISAYSRDERDRHDPMVDVMESRTWHSRAGQGFITPVDPGASGAMAPIRSRVPRPSQVGFSGVMSGRADYGSSQGGTDGMPVFLMVTVPIIVILLIVIVVLLVF